MSVPAARPRRPGTTVGARWPVPRGVRHALLVVHLLAVGVWIGMDVMLAVLVVTPVLAEPSPLVSACYLAMPTVGAAMFVAAVASLLTGLGLGVTTHWGLVRHRWVAIKLAINVVLGVLVVVLLLPGLDAAAAHGRALLVDPAASADVSSLFFPPAVSGAALVVAVVLSVVKPRSRRVRPR